MSKERGREEGQGGRGDPQGRMFWDTQHGAKKTKHPSFPSARDREPAERGWCRGEGWPMTAGGCRWPRGGRRGQRGPRTELLEGRSAWTPSGRRREERGAALGGHPGLGGCWPLSNPSSTSQQPCPPEPWLQ